MTETSYNLPRRIHELSYAQHEALVEARVSFMTHAPFFSYLYLDQLEEYFTTDIDTLATDGRRVFINPQYFIELRPTERAFGLAHETYHVMLKDAQRMKHYKKLGEIEGLPFDKDLANRAMDYRINADLLDQQVGTCNPAWLYDPNIKPLEIFEEVYKKIYQPGTTGSGNGETLGANKRGQHGRPDKRAQANGGGFDEVLEPYQDPISGKEDVPSDMEFKEAVARAATAAKAAGKLPGSIERLVQEILEPQVQWRDHLRLTVTSRLGVPRETWDSPNRRRVVLNPMIYLPGRGRYGANDVTVVVDNSGSISEKELSVFFSEACAIINDCRPRLVRVIWCDAEVRRVEEARSLDELQHIRVQGSKGGGGTAFNPPFAWLEERDVRPDTLIYFTDGIGSWPRKKPDYPVIWCSTTKGVKPPFGDLVEVVS